MYAPKLAWKSFSGWNKDAVLVMYGIWLWPGNCLLVGGIMRLKGVIKFCIVTPPSLVIIGMVRGLMFLCKYGCKLEGYPLISALPLF